MTRRIAVVSAGLSNPSSTRMLADRLAASTVSDLATRGVEATVDIIELRDLAHDITNNLLTGFAPKPLEEAIEKMVTADGLIVVTPIFSTSYSGLFKSFFDVIDPDALTGMPVLIGANAGTARHSLAIDYAIRPLFAYLHAEAVPTGVFAASSDWGAAADEVKPLASRIERGARELAEVMANRDARSIIDPFSPEAFLGEGRSFGHLLGGLAGE